MDPSWIGNTLKGHASVFDNEAARFSSQSIQWRRGLCPCVSEFVYSKLQRWQRAARVNSMTNVCAEEKLMIFLAEVNGHVTHRNGLFKWKWPQSIFGHLCSAVPESNSESKDTHTHTKILHTDTHMSPSSHTSITHVSVVSLTIQKRYAAVFFLFLFCTVTSIVAHLFSTNPANTFQA